MQVYSAWGLTSTFNSNHKNHLALKDSDDLLRERKKMCEMKVLAQVGYVLYWYSRYGDDDDVS